MIKHKGTRTLHSSRLILRRFYLGDADAMFRHWAHDPQVTKYLSWPRHQTAADSLRVVRSWEPDFLMRDKYHWAIEAKDLGEAIGSIAVNVIDESIDAVEIGYALGQAFWGEGYMTEALQAVIRFFFEEVGVKRIEGRHDVENIASGRVMQKAGMKAEGLLRQAGRNNLGIRDIKVYSILRSDYFANESH